MSAPILIEIPHQLGKQEAIRRFKSGLQRARNDFSHLLVVEDESWTEDKLILGIRALGQRCHGTVTIFDRSVRLEVQLPWLLAALAGRFMPALQRETSLLLEKR